MSGATHYPGPHDDCIATTPHWHDRPYRIGEWAATFEDGWSDGRIWLSADGEHVQFHHVCNGEPKVDTLPNSVWPVPTDGHVKPSVHCTACGFHESLSLSPRPFLMDVIEDFARYRAALGKALDP